MYMTTKTAGDLAEIMAGRLLLTTGAGREIREAAGLSRADLAAALGCHVDTVVKWEAGHRRPRAEVSRRYARLLTALMTITEPQG